MRQRTAGRAERRITLFISKEDMVNFIKIIKLLEFSDVATDGLSETVNHGKKTIRRISWYFIKNFRCFIDKICCLEKA